jgi:hypothetical protein
MRKVITWSTLLSLAMVTGCGAVSPTTTDVNNTANTPNPSVNQTGATANNTANATSSPQNAITLSPFDQRQNGGILVDVPIGWTPSTITGGDYRGWKYTNPNDPNQQIIIVNSSCVGCYMTNGKIDPTAPIPEKNPENVTVFNNGLSARYQFTKSGNPYPGQGVLTVSANKNGYGYVEVLLPSSLQTTAAQILNSFKFTL